MPKVEEVRVLNIDGVPRVVDNQSEEVKSMVRTFNEWNQKEADARDEVMMIQAAKQVLQRQIVDQIQKEDQAKQEAEAANNKGGPQDNQVEEGKE